MQKYGIKDKKYHTGVKLTPDCALYVVFCENSNLVDLKAFGMNIKLFRIKAVLIIEVQQLLVEENLILAQFLYMLHHPDMHFDLDSLEVGVSVFKRCVEKVLG